MRTINNETRQEFLNAVKARNPDTKTISRKEIISICNERNLPFPNWLANGPQYKTNQRGVFYLDTNDNVAEMKGLVSPTEVSDEKDSLIPERITGYVPFGCFNDVKKVTESNIFYPLFITGLSGNGKTLAVEQVHAQLDKEMIRVNITHETDEDDLLGGFRLFQGNTRWESGPVVVAMERGCGLLLDECLDENEKVRIGTTDSWTAIPLKNLEFNVVYPTVSFNMGTGQLENDTGSIISDKDDELYEITLEDGNTIRANGKHPFIVKLTNGTFVEKTIEEGLCNTDDIVKF